MAKQLLFKENNKRKLFQHVCMKEGKGQGHMVTEILLKIFPSNLKLIYLFCSVSVRKISVMLQT